MRSSCCRPWSAPSAGAPRPSARAACQTPGAMRPGDTARLYHRLTSYAPDREWDAPLDDPRIVQGFQPNELATFPAHCKTYPDGLPATALPRTWDPGSATATAVL